MGQGSAHGSAPVDDDDDDSSVEEMLPVKAKKPSRRASMAKEKEPPKTGQWRKRSRYFMHDFTLEHCYNILKDHQSWLGIETLAFYKNTKGEKSSRLLKPPWGSGGFNLNNEVDESEEEIQEKRAMGRDRAKAKKKSSAFTHEGSSSFVDLVVDKFLNMKKEKWGKREEQQQSYIQLKNPELDIREAERREAAELKREKLSTQRRTLELTEREKRDRDILFYNSEISSSLPCVQLQKLQEMKDEINERYNLDY
ncbi:RNA-directed DNA polymerase, eukaryota [Tanacetum coccineum]